MALKVRTIKVSDEMWERWQARAAVGSTSVAALIITSMEGQQPGPPDFTDAITQQQAATIAQMQIALDAANEDIRRLKQDAARAARKEPERRETGDSGAQPAIGGKLLGNPVMTSAVPERVSGAVPWCGLKGMDKPKGKGKR